MTPEQRLAAVRRALIAVDDARHAMEGLRLRNDGELDVATRDMIRGTVRFCRRFAMLECIDPAEVDERLNGRPFIYEEEHGE